MKTHPQSLSRSTRTPDPKPAKIARPWTWIQAAEAIQGVFSKPEKQTHKLPPQACVLWTPARGQYVAYASPDTIRTCDHPVLAVKLSEDEAEEKAQVLHARFGIRTVIRPYFAQA